MSQSERRLMVFVIAGPNGSGKSTISSYFETVISSQYKLNILKKAKGYFVKCVFVLTADPRINIERVNARVASGGHAVPEDKIRNRYIASLANIKSLIALCDILHVYDNSLDKPVRIIRKHKNDFSIFPNAIWTQKRILSLMVD